MTETEQNEIIVNDNEGIGGNYLQFEENKRIFFTFTNPRTIQHPTKHSEKEPFYVWTCDLLKWDGKNTKDEVIQIGHVDFRKKMNEKLKNKDKTALFKVGVKISERSKPIKYDFENFEVLNQ